MPSTAGLLMTACVGPTAVAGVPPESDLTRVTWQPGFAWLCWLTASSVALAIACPRAAFWPARVPT